MRINTLKQALNGKLVLGSRMVPLRFVFNKILLEFLPKGPTGLIPNGQFLGLWGCGLRVRLWLVCRFSDVDFFENTLKN